MVSFVFRPSRKRDGVSPVYRGRYRLDPYSPMVEVALDTTDKKVARKRLDDIVKEKQWEREGLIAPKLQREAAQRPLVEHLAEFRADLAALGRSKSYDGKIKARVGSLLEACGWKVPADVKPNDFVAWRAAQTEFAPKTLNEYLNAMNTFLNWMVRQERIAANPLQNIPKVDVRGKQQHRRAFTDEELTKLLSVAEHFRLIYLTAIYTGLRHGELTQLIWADVQLDHKCPHFVVRAATTKNRRTAIIPLHPNLIEELKAARAKGVDGKDRIFVGCTNPDRAIRRHMEKVGIQPVDDLGRKVDFHALRYTFATRLAQSGVTQRTTQELMRHSDPKLTANIYTDVTLLPTFDAVKGLSWIGEVAPVSVAQISPHQPPQKTALNGQNSAQVVTFSEDQKLLPNSFPEPNCVDLASTGTEGHWRRGGDSNPRYGCPYT